MSNLYKDYLNLLQLSTAAGYVCRLISQIDTWHQFHEAAGQQEIVLVEDDDEDYSPAVYTLEDDDDGDFDEQIIVTDLFNLGPGALTADGKMFILSFISLAVHLEFRVSRY